MSMHFDQKPKRKATFIKPNFDIKEKVGTGGLSEAILSKAQKFLEENTEEFEPLANLYLTSLAQGIDSAKDYGVNDDLDQTLSHVIYPAMQLKANGGMFHYSLVSAISDKLVQFLEVIEEPDIEALEIMMAFHTTIRAVIQGKIKGNGGQHGADLLEELDQACRRYFSR
ncbi:MAG: hypothetical protein CBB87_07470 [Micavibrio sp. TMED27]|nr:hypothetical protein [Micavibrio sp.]OUT90961.1 MAG: hypothetical protein CBB87_07470 [Micavibrio sp. TMED27]